MRRAVLAMVCVLAAAGAIGYAASRGSATRAREAQPVAAIHCSDVWTGPDRGDWARAGNWSSQAVPGERSQACIPRGVTVVVSHGRNRVSAVEAGGGLIVRGGALLLMGASIASEVADLRVEHAVLGGPGKLIVTRHMFWGPAGAMLGVGDVVLGPASRNVIAAGTGAEAAVLGGDDGTGPHPFDSKNAPAPACNRYSPPWATACATRHRAADQAIRRVWAQFVRRANAAPAGLQGLVRLLAPQTCAFSDHVAGKVPRGDCRHIARAVVRRARAQPLLVRLRTVYVEGDRAVSRTAAPGSEVRFSRIDGRWLVDQV